MNASPSFLRHFLINLRTSFFLVVAVVLVVLGYALIRGSDADWNIVIFMAIGMFVSSLVNALYDAKKARSGGAK